MYLETHPEAGQAMAMVVASITAQVGTELDGVVGVLVQYAGVGGAAVAALILLARAYRLRSSVDAETIETLREELNRTRLRVLELEERIRKQSK